MCRFKSSRWISTILSAILGLLVTYGLLTKFENSRQLNPTAANRIQSQQHPIHKVKPPSEWHNDLQWAKLPVHYPVHTLQELPKSGSKAIPRIQYKDWHESPQQQAIRGHRREAVVGNFTHSWRGYKDHAWLKDEVGPLSGQAFDHFGGWAASMVDSLDSLLLMGLKEEFEEATLAVEKIDFNTCALEELNIFETTIRYLGGLLAAWDLSGRKHDSLLHKAMELGELIYKAFDTPNHMPIVRFNWQKAMNGERQEASDSSLVAEVGSLSLELTYLAQVTGDDRFYDAVQRIMDVFNVQQNTTRLPGLFPLVVNPRDMDFTNGGLFTLGGMVDSLYEYLPKEYLLLGGQSSQYQKLYEDALVQMKHHIFFRPMTPDGADILFAGSVDVETTPDVPAVKLNPEVQHLTCFVGGMVALGAKAFGRDEDLELARKLVDGCIWAYSIMPRGIMPEIMHVVPCISSARCEWDEERWFEAVKALNDADVDVKDLVRQNRLPPGIAKIDDTRYGLRPEAIESVFILYRITGDSKLQDKAWNMFESIIAATRTDIGAAALSDCVRPEIPPTDRMESFWLAETLKYFYLMFSEPELLSLDEYVLNTEAHPFRRPTAIS